MIFLQLLVALFTSNVVVSVQISCYHFRGGPQNWAKVNYVVYGKKVPGQESLLGEHHQNACTHTLGLLKRSFFIEIARDFLGVVRN